MATNTSSYLPLMPLDEPSENLELSPRDSTRPSPEPLNAFHSLVADINAILGPCNGIDSADVNVEHLKSAMAAYTSHESDWEKYAYADYGRAYTRNLVDYGNGKANLLVLVWTPGKSSPVHDHANAHCVMKVLKGSLTETVYGWPCQQREDGGGADCATAFSSLYPSTQHTCSAKAGELHPAALLKRRETTYCDLDGGQVTYMSDQLGLHRIGNPSLEQVAVSLHLYTPPNAAKHGCHIFDEATGKSSHVKQCHFNSELGVKTE